MSKEQALLVGEFSSIEEKLVDMVTEMWNNNKDLDWKEILESEFLSLSSGDIIERLIADEKGNN